MLFPLGKAIEMIYKLSFTVRIQCNPNKLRKKKIKNFMNPIQYLNKVV